MTARSPSARQCEPGRFTRSWKTAQADSVAPLPTGRVGSGDACVAHQGSAFADVANRIGEGIARSGRGAGRGLCPAAQTEKDVVDCSIVIHQSVAIVLEDATRVARRFARRHHAAEITEQMLQIDQVMALGAFGESLAQLLPEAR
jgi:hypothetical protein